MTSSCILGSVQVENSRKSGLPCFSSDLLENWYGGNFKMLITKKRPKLKLEKNLQFLTDFSQNYTKHSLTITLPLQQWMSHGTGLPSR